MVKKNNARLQDTQKSGRASPALDAALDHALGPQGPRETAAALTTLRKRHRSYVRSCGLRFRDVPFRSRMVPDWIYDPTTDTIRRTKA